MTWKWIRWTDGSRDGVLKTNSGVEIPDRDLRLLDTVEDVLIYLEDKTGTQHMPAECSKIFIRNYTARKKDRNARPFFMNGLSIAEEWE